MFINIIPDNQLDVLLHDLGYDICVACTPISYCSLVTLRGHIEYSSDRNLTLTNALAAAYADSNIWFSESELTVYVQSMEHMNHGDGYALY